MSHKNATFADQVFLQYEIQYTKFNQTPLQTDKLVLSFQFYKEYQTDR